MNVFHQLVDLIIKIDRAGDLECVFEPMIKRQALKQLDDIALKRRPQLRVHFLRERGLLLNLLQVRDELAEGKIFARLRAQAECRESFRISNHENLPLICFVLLHQHLGQPIHCGERAVIGAESLLALNDEKRIARDGVERLDSSIQQDGEAAEFLHLETVPGIVLNKRRDGIEERPGHNQPNQQ